MDKGLGLSQSQVANLIAAFPSVLGMSIASNLRLKHELLQKFYLAPDAAKLLARTPRLWSYRLTRLEHRLHVLKSQGKLSKLVGAMKLKLDDFNRRFSKSRLQTEHQLLEQKDLTASCHDGSPHYFQ